MEEIWKDIKGFEGLYMVSNFGRIKNVPHWVTRNYIKPSTKQHIIDHLFIKEKIITIKLKKRHTKRANGKTMVYAGASLRKGGKYHNKQIHRLVAEAFIDNPNNYPCVNHIDGNTMNNCASNLEWCTYSHNNSWDNRVERAKESYKNNPKNKRWVYQYTLDWKFIKAYPWKTTAVKENGWSEKNTGGITGCCEGKYKQYKGFRWTYQPINSNAKLIEFNA